MGILKVQQKSSRIQISTSAPNRPEELCRGCLTDRVKAQSNGQHLPHDELPSAMRQIFSAVFYLHQKNIIHRVSWWNVKTENVVSSGCSRG